MNLVEHEYDPSKHLHERPKKIFEERFDFPAHVQYFSYFMTDPPSDRLKSQGEFKSLLDRLGVPEHYRTFSEKFGFGVKTAENGDQLYVIWEAHTEYYSHQIWHIPDDKLLPIEYGPITFPDYDYLPETLGVKVNALDILVLPDAELTTEQIQDLMPEQHIYGSQVFGKEITVLTSFTADVHHAERYLVFSADPEALSRHLIQVIDGIVTTETYYHLLMRPFPDFSKAIDQIHQLEQILLQHSQVLSTDIAKVDAETAKQWLKALTSDFMAVGQFGEQMRLRLSSSLPYYAIVQATVRAQQEQPFPPFLPLYDYMLGSVSGVADGYQQLLKRINVLIADFQSIISVIRARVNLMLQEQNLILEDQNFKLLVSMDKTTKSQAILQHTVESLSVIVIAYYLSGLGSYLFKALEKMGWIESATMASGIFVPASLALSLALTLVGRRIIHKMMSPEKH